MHQITTVID